MLLRKRIYNDGGYGVTKHSLIFFQKHLADIGDIQEVLVKNSYDKKEDKWNLFTMKIKGEKGVIYLSGCNCGYGGEGPHGTYEIIKKIGITNKSFWETKIPYHDKIKWIKVNGKWKEVVVE